MSARRWAAGLVVALASSGAACSSTSLPTPGSAAVTRDARLPARIPAAAFEDHTGITATAVDVANISTLTDGVYRGAAVGTLAYADYVNASGGIDGRRIVVNLGDDGSTGAGNRSATQDAIVRDFALVGGFSSEDGSGGAVLRADPGMPDVTVTPDQATGSLPNAFSPVPMAGGWVTGPFRYLRARYPGAVDATAGLVSGLPAARSGWRAERYALERTGFHVVYDPGIPAGRTDFTANVAAMKHAGIGILVLDQLPVGAAAAVLRELAAEDFHPLVVLGAADYGTTLVPEAGGAAAEGAYLEQASSLYLGQDAAAIPAVPVLDRWVGAVAPGFRPDLFTLYGWLSAELFADALHRSGPDPSRGSLLRALAGTTSFSGDGLVAPSDPAAKVPSPCYLLARVSGGRFARIDTPPPGPTGNGFRCDGRYLVRPPS